MYIVNGNISNIHRAYYNSSVIVSVVNVLPVMNITQMSKFYFDLGYIVVIKHFQFISDILENPFCINGNKKIVLCGN